MLKKDIDGNTDTGLLKILALLFMIVDHVGVRLFRDVQELRIIGRMAFPLYVWCIVVGTVYTRDPLKYALRLLIAAVIAQPFYMIGLNHSWDQFNVMYTLLLGYMAVAGIRFNRCGSRFWAPALCLLTTNFVTVDYGMNGVLLAILLYLCREKRGAIAAVMTAFCLYWGNGSTVLTTLFGYRFSQDQGFIGAVAQLNLVRVFLKLQALAALSLPLILWQRKKRTPFPKWAAYAAYPGHLLILWIVQLLMGKTTLLATKRLLFPFM